jgi:hypothetical protein
MNTNGAETTTENWSAWSRRVETPASALGYTRSSYIELLHSSFSLLHSIGAHGRICTGTVRILSALSLPWTTWAMNFCILPSAFYIQKVVLPAGFPPATATFEASHSNNLSYGSERNAEGGMKNAESRRPLAVPKSEFFLLHSSFFLPNGGPPRICTEFSPGKSRDFTSKVCNPVSQKSEVRDQRSDFENTRLAVSGF